MIFDKPTSKEIWDKYPDKNSYPWLSSGIHVFNVLKKEEEKEQQKLIDQRNKRYGRKRK